MIIDYTPQEQALRNTAYTNWLNEDLQYDETIKDAAKHPEWCDQLKAERANLKKAYLQQIKDIQTKAEMIRLDAMHGDISLILKEAKRQVKLTLEHYIEITENTANLITKISTHGPVNDELAKSFDEIELDFKTRFVDGRPALERQHAWAMIWEQVEIIYDYMVRIGSEEAKSACNELNDYIRKVIELEPHIYDKTLKTKESLSQINTFSCLNDKGNHRMTAFDNFEITAQTANTVTYFAGVRQKDPNIFDGFTLTFTNIPQNLSRPVGILDAPIYNAVSTAFFYHQLYGGTGSLIITPQEIWRLICGTQDTNRNPSPNQLKQITDTIDRMRFTRIKIDLSKSIKHYHLQFDDDRVINGEIDTYYLEASKGRFMTEKGRIVSGYEIPRAPIMYVYAAAKDHILTVPLSLLDTGETTGNEGITPAVRQYLLNRILLMYHDRKYKRKILYESLYTATGIQPPELRLNRENFSTDTSFDTATRREAARDREKVKEILDAWKAKRLILDYEPLKEGRKNVGVNIVLYKGTPPALTRKNQ